MPTLQMILEKDQILFQRLTQPLQDLQPGLRQILRVVSHLGDGHLWVVLAIGLALHLHSWRLLAGSAVGVIGSLLAFRLIKNWVKRHRPSSPVASKSRILVPMDEYSFPSGHASTSMAAAICLGSYAPVLAPALFALALCIAFSRIALKAHYPLDIAAGWLLGACMASAGLLCF
jgi:undecaprenyl-diphosphatase